MTMRNAMTQWRNYEALDTPTDNAQDPLQQRP